MNSISDKFSQPAFDKVGGYEYVEGPKFEMPANQTADPAANPVAQTEKQVFEDGLKKLGLYDLVRHLNYPLV